MSGPFKRRASLKTLPAIALPKDADMRRRRSSVGLSHPSNQQQQHEVPWDMVDRCLLPVLFCQAAAIILSTVLNTLHISQVSSFTLFIWFTISTVGAVLFYHNLKVTAAGKAILVTGCDSRIGYALARYLDEQGFTVFAGFQNAEGSAYADDLREESSGRMHVLQMDVSNETQVLSGSLYIVEHLPDGAPGLWAVIHCAQWVAFGEIEWVPHQVLRKATEINLLGSTRVNQVMMPLLRRARGRVIFMTSGLCKVASPVRGMHCALLSAVEAQASCLRQELRSRGVDVVVVAPGEFTSGSAWLSDEEMRDQAKDMWDQLSQEQRGAYGEDYFETAIRSLEKFTKAQQDADLTPVLRALSEAVIRTFPLPRYTPVTRQEKLQAFIADHFPRSFYDIIYTEK